MSRKPVARLESHLGYWLRFVSNQVSHAFARKVQAQGVTVAEWVILRELYDSPAQPSALAERLGMTRGAISKLADRLADKALIRRDASADDRRAQTLTLTAEGRALVPRLAALADQNDAEFFGDLDPSLRNVGNTWFVQTGTVSAALLADTGRDPAGSMQDVALEARRRWGRADVVFGGMRGFALCPLMLPFTTLDAMFVNVPIELMGVRQRLMNDPADLLTVSEVFGARYAVPYADGGAPWYYREGMGPAYQGYPAYPGEKEAPEEDAEDPDSAPFPERLSDVAEARYGSEPLIENLLLRPGDLVRWSKSGPEVGRIEGFAWPYEEDTDEG